jgi:hypothetical protein
MSSTKKDNINKVLISLKNLQTNTYTNRTNKLEYNISETTDKINEIIN